MKLLIKRFKCHFYFLLLRIGKKLIEMYTHKQVASITYILEKSVLVNGTISLCLEVDGTGHHKLIYAVKNDFYEFKLTLELDKDYKLCHTYSTVAFNQEKSFKEYISEYESFNERLEGNYSSIEHIFADISKKFI